MYVYIYIYPPCSLFGEVFKIKNTYNIIKMVEVLEEVYSHCLAYEFCYIMGTKNTSFILRGLQTNLKRKVYRLSHTNLKKNPLDISSKITQREKKF